MPRRTGRRAVAAEKPVTAHGRVDRQATTRTSVLVVDDSEDAQELFRASLEQAGYEVIAARDGKDALEQLERAHAPGLIIVDLLMPVMDGMELIDVLRSDPRLAHVPVLVVSAVDVPRNVRLPETRYLRKPFRSIELLTNIEELLRSPSH